MARGRRSNRRANVPAIALIVVACAIVVAIGWIGSRGLLARSALEHSVSLAGQVQEAVTSGDSDAAVRAAVILRHEAAQARALTGDPVWRLAEAVPAVGSNLAAVRQISEVVDEIARDAMDPLLELADTFDASSLQPQNGAIDLAALAAIEAPVTKAEASLSQAAARAKAIPREGTVDQIASAVNDLQQTVEDAAETVSAVRRVATLLPPMLGADGDRRYLLLFQNNAESRATGGSPSAMAVVSASGGTLTLERQASSSDFPGFPDAVMPLTPELTSNFTSRIGRYIQDVNLTPDFPTTATIAREMWKQKFGQDVDGVMSVDTVTLSYLLKATGPLEIQSGFTLTPENAVKTLLRDVYSVFPGFDDAEFRRKDEIFASVSAKVFAAISGGKADPGLLLEAFARSGSEHRVLLWSADAAEQATIAQTSIAGILPTSNRGGTIFGVYLNDNTGSKMDVYLDRTITRSTALCRADGRPSYRISLELTSTAPADAATSLPPYVTGAGIFGTAPGNISTRVFIYGPAGADLLGGLIGGEAVPFSSSLDGTRPVAQAEIELAPGESRKFEVDFVGDAAPAGPLSVWATPGPIQQSEETGNLSCESALRWSGIRTTGA